MLAIRMQRTGRKGHATFRVVVQDTRQTPTSGRVVALLGNYDPHTKAATLNKDGVTSYLKNGAQPSQRVAMLLKKEGVTLPEWVQIDTSKAGTLRHGDKLRKNRPAEEVKPAEAAEVPAEEAVPATDQAVPAAEETTEAQTATTEEPAVEAEAVPAEPEAPAAEAAPEASAEHTPDAPAAS